MSPLTDGAMWAILKVSRIIKIFNISTGLSLKNKCSRKKKTKKPSLNLCNALSLNTLRPLNKHIEDGVVCIMIMYRNLGNMHSQAEYRYLLFNNVFNRFFYDIQTYFTTIISMV